MAALLIALVLLLSLASASPTFHTLIHADAGDAHHHCIVTEFTHGNVQLTGSAVIASVALLFVAIVFLSDSFVLPLADYRFSASRAPPV